MEYHPDLGSLLDDRSMTKARRIREKEYYGRCSPGDDWSPRDMVRCRNPVVRTDRSQAL